MPIPKYICRCGNKTDIQRSYFIGPIRVTVCEKCEGQVSGIEGAVVMDYDDVKKESSKQIIDTREK